MERSSADILSSVPAAENNNNVLNLKETELRLGLPGSVSPERKPVSEVARGYCPLKNFLSGAKRGFRDATDSSEQWAFSGSGGSEVPDFVKGPVLAQVVGWPPIKSYRKNTLAPNICKKADVAKDLNTGYIYVKVSMDGAPYLRKVDLKTCCNYAELSSALESMFSCFTIGQCSSKGLPEREGLSASRLMDLVHGSEYVLTYEDKDGDWMLVGDVPWKMFTDSCKRLRIMKGSEAIGLAPRTMEKCQSQH
ncbi:hypothetical protein DCAR_0518550 [Daucus carota subsp. sativus]|uniref:Auxin-responsive protein n=1 Tax=Daucus carota subsp. sativus TaxID=79200 RepID=A0AAF0X0S6_DAUCS|nr:hypothetical protein DCAR_0518550 [Daucus carota subsp. sativus]